MAEVASSSTTTGTPTDWIRRSRQLVIQNSRNWLMAWEVAAKAYQELLMDMCWQKLAPNLPYVKSLF
ncbi:putative DNA-directed RNA polymerase [Helianthus annuus]|uniref:DNA-directed RNA polymerase n=1 Tax=Helianthus annuus TaxID=4232 RepID=A0A251SX34_HELAN|nr:putative DNA-directed RNA polymerase [Helianthus annuus]KAJ0478712.1 putative DNA-directed RNA polymerase [Helianthus annuus]KAJ0499594.1 putative DNA-directed RNA polymerase [Helianthus annuus]KAJ0665606.1 putative DNA-directed RNA polymerase [Helianthus annuus]